MNQKALDKLIDAELSQREDEMGEQALEDCAAQVYFKEDVPRYFRKLCIIHCAALLLIDRAKLN